MKSAKINSLLAASYNIHFGEKLNKVMAASEAAKLSRADRVALAYVLREKGGSDFYTKEDADNAYIALIG